MFNEEVTREEKRLATIFLILDILHIIVEVIVLGALSCWTFDLLVNRQQITQGVLAFICVGIFLYRFIKMLCEPDKNLFVYLIHKHRKGTQ